MADTDRTLKMAPSLEESTIRRIVSVFVALAGLLVVLGLVAVLPGIDRLVAGLTVEPMALLTAVATLLVVLALVWVAPTVQRALAEGLDGPPGAVTNAAAAAKYLTVFLAVLVAYHGFAGAVTPLFRAFDLGGVYHLVFLVAGLLVLAAFVRRLVRCWRPVTGALTAAATNVFGHDQRDGISTD